ncbi:MAG: LysR family transcriptional regulator [Polyangiaceae bacterium]
MENTHDRLQALAPRRDRQVRCDGSNMGVPNPDRLLQVCSSGPAEAWRAMLNWDDLRYFLALHRNNNLARAASELKVNATTVGRRLSALEEQVGARLFDRTPDGYIPTSAGVELVHHAERMEAEAFGAERRLSGADTRLEGSVRVSVTEMLATRFIASHLRTFHAKHPGITLELVPNSKKDHAPRSGRRCA